MHCAVVQREDEKIIALLGKSQKKGKGKGKGKGNGKGKGHSEPGQGYTSADFAALWQVSKALYEAYGTLKEGNIQKIVQTATITTTTKTTPTKITHSDNINNTHNHNINSHLILFTLNVVKLCYTHLRFV